MTRTIALLLTATTLAFCQESTPPPQHRQVDRPPYAPPSLLLKHAPPLHPVDPLLLIHGQRDRKVIALTFDACATRKPGQYDERITKILVETKTAATLFLGGKWMEDDTEQTKYLAGIPFFELGNHTFLHPHLLKMSDERIRQELAWTQQILYSLTGKQSTLFRPPYGEEDDRVVRIAASMGLTTIQYDLASGDPDSSISKERLVQYVSLMAKNGSIIVMHMNRRGWHTAEALPEIISRLRKRGFAFVTVGELMSGLPSAKAAKQKAGD